MPLKNGRAPKSSSRQPANYFSCKLSKQITSKMQLQNLFLALAAAATAQAGVIERQNACSSYTIINTRGTGEAQGPSAGFRTMNANIQRQLSGGKIYNTVYAADASQNSAAGTADIVRKVQSTLASNPNECFILEGYSQGAAATTNALPKLTGASFNAVKGVFLIGNPEHRSGLAVSRRLIA
jgi:predicted esterase